MILESKNLIYSKKWIIYIILSLIPFIFSLLNANKLGELNATETFVNFVINSQFGFFYVFGVLLLALPNTSDEITDHIMDLFLIRPIFKEIIFLVRYLIILLATSIINGFLILFYYIYFYVIDEKDMIEDLNLLIGAIVFIIIANVIYSALFLGIGFIGSGGFRIGVFVAILELFFLNFLFLVDDPSLPRTNLKVIADRLFGDNFTYSVGNKVLPDFSTSIIYIIVVTIVFLIIGLIYFKKREFN
jgi:ABC-type transport system involved in multi-copper enzyme maturation permease subunit